jgi:NADPH:quinone reductase-like Zn-dependent oxidoreductase
MRAAIIAHYGPPNVFEIRDVPQPEVAPGKVLVRVHAASVNPVDWRIRNGSLRFVLPVRLPLVLGYDIAGVVVEVGPGVSEFKPGDEVFAYLDSFLRGGGYAELALASRRVLAPKPGSLSFVEAAAVPLAATTALQALRDYGQIHSQSHVLVNGASGGVGTFAIQIAKMFGAEVTGVCGPSNVELVQQLGADRVVDYTKTDFTQEGRQYDIVLDAVAKSSYTACRRVLKPKGHYISTLPSPKQFLDLGLTWLLGGLRSHTFFARPDGSDLRHLKELIESGKVRPVIDRTFPLEEVAKAHELSQAGHARGKIVLEVVR